MNETLDNSVSGRPGINRYTASMRAAWVVSGSTCLRLGRSLGSLAGGLADEGIYLAAICGDDAPVGAFSDWPIDVTRFFMRRWFRPGRAIARLGEKLQEQGVQLLHALDAEAGQTTSLLASQLNCPHVVSSYSLDDGRALGRMGVRPAMVLAASQSVRLDLINSHCIRPDRVTVAPPPAHPVAEANCFRRPDRCASIVTSDVFDDYGAVAAVLDAFAKLQYDKTECLFFAVGNGPAEHALRKHAEKLGLCGSLTFVDRLDSRQLAGVFEAADIYISPRGTSSVNLDAMLAMASGAAVLAPEDHVSDFLIDGQTASTFRSRDAKDIAEHLGDMLSNRERTVSLAEGALEYLAENHRPWRAVQSVAEVYNGVLAGSENHVPLSA